VSRLLDGCRRHPVLLALPTALIVVATLAAVAGSKWYLTGDFAHTEFLVRAIPRHPPLIGVAARVQDQGSTPGPSMAYLLYPFYKLFGSNAFALAVAVNVLHIAAVSAAVVVARRVGGTSIAAMTGLTLAATTMAVAPRFFLEPWNVWVPVFAFALFVVLIWGVACEHLALLPVAVAVGSHCVQTHISYTVLVGGLLVGTLVWLGWLWWRTTRLADVHLLRWLAIATATLFVCWLPPLLDQLRPGVGNMRKLYHQFADPTAPFVGPLAATKAMIGRFNMFGPWINDPQSDPRSSPNYVGFVLFIALVGCAGRLAWRRRERVEITLYIVLAGVTALGFMSTTRIFGTFFEYVIRWMSPLVALWVATSLWSLWLTWKERSATPMKAAGVVAAATLVITVVGVARAATAEIPYSRDSAITGALAAQLEQSLGPALRYQINEFDPVALGSPAFGLALETERHGLHAGVGPWGAAGVMPFRVVDDQRADATLWYVAGDPVIAAFSTLPDAKVQALFDVRTPTEAKRSNELEAQLVGALCKQGGVPLARLLFARWGHTALAYNPDLPSDAVGLLQQYTDLRQPAAVIELPVGVNGYDVAPQPPEHCTG
jgi:hypothetical protein